MDEKRIKIPGWKIIRTIGKGSFGCVYEVEKEGVFGAVAHSALKVISIPETDAEVKAYRDDGYDDKSLTDLFRTQVEDITAEFELMSKLKGDSHIVSYEDHSIVQHEHDPGYDIFIRMELLTPLPDYINRTFPDNRIPDAAVAALGTDICRALERCGRHNIIHRDIKPQNIFVNEEEDFKLGDFGIAKTSDHTTRATKTGTYGYMAPEVYWGRPYNAAVDIYSLGLVLYWMLNERRGPFLPMPPAVPRPSQNSEAMERRMNGEALPAPKNGSEELKRIVLKACAFDPKDRYQNPAEMRRDLERAVAAKEETETIAVPVRPIPPVSADTYEATVGTDRKETDVDHTVSAMSGPVRANEPERPAPVIVPTPVLNEIRAPQQKETYEATVGLFRAEKTTNTASSMDETMRIAAEPIRENGTAAYAEDADATVGLFTKKPEAVKPFVRREPETAKPPIRKEAERKTEHMPKPEKPAEKPEPEKTQADRKAAGKGFKKTLLIIVAAAALAMIAAVVLIVVLVSKGKPSQQAETDPTAAPAEAPTDAPTAVPTDAPTQKPTEKPTDAPISIQTDAPTSVPTEAPTPTQTQNPTEKPTEKPTPTPEPTSTQTPYSKPTASMEKNAADGYVNADSVEMREGPGTNYNIVNASVERYTVVKLYVEQDGWWFLKCRDQYGYIRKDYIAKGTVPESAETQAYLPLTLSARFLLITTDDEILQIEGRTAPGASLTFVKPDYETVIGYYPSTDAEGLFMYEFKISDSSFRGMTKAEIIAEKDGLQNTAEFVILRGFEDKTAFLEYYNYFNKYKKYIEINHNGKGIADILGNLTEYAGGKYGFRISATVVDVFEQGGDTVVKMVIEKTGETVYVRNYSETWRPTDNIGGKYNVYCNLVGTYENTGCCEFIGWFAKVSK